jgi:hypothetical protein
VLGTRIGSSGPSEGWCVMTRSIASRRVAPSSAPRLYVLVWVLVLVAVLVVVGLTPEAAVAVVGGCLAAVEVAVRLVSAPTARSAR